MTPDPQPGLPDPSFPDPRTANDEDPANQGQSSPAPVEGEDDAATSGSPQQ